MNRFPTNRDLRHAAMSRSVRAAIPEASRRPWATPQVILGTMEGAELNVGFGSDGGTPFNDAS